VCFSAITHKEVRFISPLSPLVLVFAGFSISRLSRRMKRILLPIIVLVNVALAYYVTRVHQAGVISVMHYLREDIPINGSVGFLMPCYSTPWQIYLQRPDVDAWKLTCEPPLRYTSSPSLFYVDVSNSRLSKEERKSYIDEADRFYADPQKFLNSITRWPDRLVFFDSLTKELDQYKEIYHEVHFPSEYLADLVCSIF